MYRNQTKKLSTHYNSGSILVISNEGIYRLFCPFKAICISKVASFIPGQTVIITAVKINSEYRLIYIIQGRAFYHSHFVIISLPNLSLKDLF